MSVDEEYIGMPHPEIPLLYIHRFDRGEPIWGFYPPNATLDEILRAIDASFPPTPPKLPKFVEVMKQRLVKCLGI